MLPIGVISLASLFHASSEKRSSFVICAETSGNEMYLPQDQPDGKDRARGFLLGFLPWLATMSQVAKTCEIVTTVTSTRLKSVANINGLSRVMPIELLRLCFQRGCFASTAAFRTDSDTGVSNSEWNDVFCFFASVERRGSQQVRSRFSND